MAREDFIPVAMDDWYQRRRRDAEEKLQQHLLQAKDHIPNEHHQHPEHNGSGHRG